MVIAAIGIGCGGGSGGEGASMAPDQELTVRIAADPGTFDPQLAAVAEEISVVKQLYRGLFTYDEDLNVVPSVAVEVPTRENGGISGDGLVYTIKLRNDATWSDGQPVTAANFVYAFKRLFDPEAGAQGYYFDFYTAIAGAAEFASGEGTAEGVQVRAIDDWTLEITLAHELPTLPTLLALWPASPLREDVIAQHGAAWTEPANFVGNGPFVLASYAPEQNITLAANTTYWGDDAPELQRMVYQVIPDDSAALIAYESGAIDMTAIPVADACRFEGNAEQVRYPQLETYALQYNNGQAPFDNVLVRQAISRAIDREAYVAIVQQNVGTPTTSWLPPGLPGAAADVGTDLDYDPEAAQALLSEAGYPDGDGFPSVTLMVPESESGQLTAEFIKTQLNETLGIDIGTETLQEDAFFDSYFGGTFDVVFLSWFADYADPENWLPQQFATDGGFNVIGYSNPQVDELLAKAAVELDPEARLALYDEAHRLVISDQAITPVYHPDRNHLVRSSVDGLTTTALDAEPGDWFVTNLQMLEGEDAQPAASEPGGC
jgi:oligopeptide transport system substrate-binding protein